MTDAQGLPFRRRSRSTLYFLVWTASASALQSANAVQNCIGSADPNAKAKEISTDDWIRWRETVETDLSTGR